MPTLFMLRDATEELKMSNKRQNIFKIAAFFKEFPFLSRIIYEQVDLKRRVEKEGCDDKCKDGEHTHETYLDPKKIVSIRVARVDDNLLSRYFEPKTGSDHITEKEPFEIVGHYEDINGQPILIDSDGDIISAIDEKSGAWFNTLGECIAKLEDPDEIEFIFILDEPEELEDDDPHQEIVVYKKPKHFTIRQWIENQKQRARKEARREISALDEAGKK